MFIEGQIPSLKLRKNGGKLSFQNTNYTTPAALDNSFVLNVLGTSILTVNGSLINRFKLECAEKAKIMVAGDLISEETIGIFTGKVISELENNGEISVGGSMTLESPVSGNGKFILLREGVVLTNNATFDGQLRFELPATADPHRFFRALAQ